MKIEDKVIAEFESVYDSGLIQAFENTSPVVFADSEKQKAWAAWQASRALIVIELPPPDSALTDNDLLTVAKGVTYD
ncbi:hypothetical protein [Pseudomonas sp.]|uniref:hypothetical protein n=1 Tax=Pseudomonas sp. TaxID=306 RepID=UPI0019F4510B|nr:hypothetical protein [Pseudomonas sp.]MBF0675542.1 hypothetical protein [Pseudomonas sp.]